jgi:competence CoiA-like predicted nuclease
LLYSYVKDETGLEHGELIQKDDKTYIVIKSIDVVIKQIERKYSYYCLSCNKQVYFRHYTDKNDHFYHKASPDCKIPESIEHLLVKMEIYKYLKLAGYEAKLETPFYRNGLSVRADVFAKSGINQLVVEVQASNSIRLDTIKKRNTIYAASGIPTAWIIVLDSFFKKYSGTSTNELIKQEDGSYLTKKIDLPYNKQEVFQVIGTTPKAFDFLMEQYHFVIAINKEGKFYLIRKESNGTVYNITRIPTHDLVNSLMTTPLIEMDYEDRKINLAHNQGESKIFKGETGFDFTHSLSSSPESIHIDFQRGLLDELERLKKETPFDTVALITKINKHREKIKQQIILRAQAMERELINERRYKPKIDIWKQKEDLRLNKISSVLTKIKEDFEKRLIEQLGFIENLHYTAIYELKLLKLKDQWKEEQLTSERQLTHLKKLYHHLIDKEEELRKNLNNKNPYSAVEENERIKQLALKRRKEMYGEEKEAVTQSPKRKPVNLHDNQRYKEKSIREREKRAALEAEIAVIEEQERILQERINKLSQMEKEAGPKFTFAISQIEKMYGEIVNQSDEVFNRSMRMLLQSYETILREKKKSSLSYSSKWRRDEMDRLI